VPTEQHEVGSIHLPASWAGGQHGRYFIDIVISLLPRLLSSKGLCYMVLLQQNQPDEIQRWVQELGLSMEVRNALNLIGNEGLFPS
jgi:hypothetical protein